MIGFGGYLTHRLVLLHLCRRIADCAGVKVVQGLADIWDSRVTVLYHRTESLPQRNVPGDAIVGSCTYFGLELLIDETQLPPQGGGFSVQEQNDRHTA